jgi:hypothetical protein
MYDPISRYVIRQSLSFSNLPAPSRIVMLDHFTYPDGRVVACYTMTFDLYAMDTACLEVWMIEGQASASYRDIIQGAFSTDIFVMDAYIDTLAGEQVLRVNFTTTVRRTDGKL